MVLELILLGAGYSEHVLGPVVGERVVVGLLHELVDLDVEEVPIGTTRVGFVGSYEGVVERREPLLSVEDDVRWLAARGHAVDRLTRQGLKVLGTLCPKQESADVVVEEDRPHEVPDVRWEPLDLTLEVGDDELTVFEAVNENG